MIDFDFKTGKKDIRLFSNIVPLALIAWGTYLGFCHGWGGRSEWILYATAVLIFFWGMISPFTLKPVYIGWMYLTRCFAWVLTTLVLGLVFYIGFTVIGFLMRLFGKDPLNRKIDRSAVSCWNRRPRSAPEREHYKKQF